MAKAARYLAQFNETRNGTSVPKYTAGTLYPVTEETKRHVVLGIAEEVDTKKGDALAAPFGDAPVDVAAANAAPAPTPEPTPASAPAPTPTPAPTPVPNTPAK